ncbi:hypothetical protein [Pseudothauera lacus]|uniref:hypothetical protein n=1 Tax=Pseudothauera lacus TaxID=2136175 RepID=UPI0015E7C344|nr:hypothetical protein [Pseudothauera lacus]
MEAEFLAAMAAPTLYAALRTALVTVAGLNADVAFNDTENTIRAALDLAEAPSAA